MGPLAVLLLLSAGIWRTKGEVTNMIGELGEPIVLPCSTGAESLSKVAWFVGDSSKEVLSCDSDSSSNSRLLRVNMSYLQITSLLQRDEGTYGCRDCLQSTATTPHIQLNVTTGPFNVTFRIHPKQILPNGTLYTSVGSNITFTCASLSLPPPKLDVVFYTQGRNPESFKNGNSNFITFSLEYIGSNYNGNYTCLAKNPATGKNVSSTYELLVYYPPLFPMQCSASNTGNHSELALFCSWLEGYPAPIIEWEIDGKFMVNATPEVLLNGSQYNTGQKLTCKGKHIIGEEIKEETCQVTLGHPVPQSQPLRTCLTGENVTLSCSVHGAYPTATIKWFHNLSNPEEIQPGNKYQIVQDSSNSFLTIVNCSKEGDEGYYICQVENALAIKNIDVWLEVTKPHNIVGLVSALLILFLLVVGLITGIIFYCDPWVYWKANPFRSGQSEVLVLVDSEEEDDIETLGNSAENIPYTASVATSIPNPKAANGNICKHEVLFHHPPRNISPGLVSEVPEDTELENQDILFF